MMLEQMVKFIFGIGLFINAILFIPQILVLLKQKCSDDLSLMTFGGFCFIQMVTIIHGYYTQDRLLMIGFASSLLTCGTVTALIIRYRLIPKAP